MEVSVVKNTNMQKNFAEKLNSVRKKAYIRFPQLQGQNLCKLMGKLAHYHYHKKKYMMLGLEKEFYNWLIENSYNPFTVYRWLLLERVPEDIRFQLKQATISQKKAVSEAFKRRGEGLKELSEAIREQGLGLIVRM